MKYISLIIIWYRIDYTTLPNIANNNWLLDGKHERKRITKWISDPKSFFFSPFIQLVWRSMDMPRILVSTNQKLCCFGAKNIHREQYQTSSETQKQRFRTHFVKMIIVMEDRRWGMKPKKYRDWFPRMVLQVVTLQFIEVRLGARVWSITKLYVNCHVRVVGFEWVLAVWKLRIFRSW